MKKSLTLLFSLLSLTLCAVLLAFGVYAATTISFTLSNSIVYHPTSTYIRIIADVYGYDENKIDKDDLNHLEHNFETPNVPNPGDYADEWVVPDLHFRNKETAITFRFFITNISENNPDMFSALVDVDLGANNSAKIVRTVERYKNSNGDMAYDQTEKLQDNDPLIVEPGETVLVRVIVKIAPEWTEEFKGEPNNFTLIVEQQN